MLEGAKNAFVCGHPINHSRSPLIHNHWLKQNGIEGTYRAIDVAPDKFADFLSGLAANGLAGGNVTIPHKEAALALADRADDRAKIIGAANTLWFQEGVLNATNTDAHGFAANLDQAAPGWDKAKNALVLGAGGASRAIIYALLARGFTSIRIANRTVVTAIRLQHQFGDKVSAHALNAAQELASDADVIINTTSLGMKGKGSIELDFTKLKSGKLVTDIVYVPLITDFLKEAENADHRIVDGLGMLLHQAAPAFEKWFGVLPEVSQELRDLIVTDMARAS